MKSKDITGVIFYVSAVVDDIFNTPVKLQISYFDFLKLDGPSERSLV